MSLKTRVPAFRYPDISGWDRGDRRGKRRAIGPPMAFGPKPSPCRPTGRLENGDGGMESITNGLMSFPTQRCGRSRFSAFFARWDDDSCGRQARPAASPHQGSCRSKPTDLDLLNIWQAASSLCASPGLSSDERPRSGAGGCHISRILLAAIASARAPSGPDLPSDGRWVRVMVTKSRLHISTTQPCGAQKY